MVAHLMFLLAKRYSPLLAQAVAVPLMEIQAIRGLVVPVVPAVESGRMAAI